MPLAFEWNPRKAELNLRKHDLSFAEAASVFADPLARIFADDVHSANEQREIIIGHLMSGKLVLYISRNGSREEFGSSALVMRPGKSSGIMKNTSRPKTKAIPPEDLQPEYKLDYTSAKPNRCSAGPRCRGRF
jgi:uncharacterized DUF497 family protein